MSEDIKGNGGATMRALFQCTRCGKQDNYCVCKTIVLAWANKILKEYLCMDCDKKYEKVIKRFFKVK